MKERHDNFFFDKAIETKNKIHDTMHFQGILKNPNTPKLILFQKQPHNGNPKYDFNNDKYLNMSSNPTFFKDFMNKMDPAHQSAMENYREEVLSGAANRDSETKLWQEFS